MRRLTHPVLAALLLLAAAPATAAETGRLEFQVLRDGAPIGRHSLSFTRHGPDELTVQIAIDLEVGLGPLVLYAYTHRNTTTWKDGRIARLTTRTDDDGTRHRVRARRGEAGNLRVTADGAARTVPGDVLPSSYWMTATVRAERLLNTQTGALGAVEVTPTGRQTIETPAGPVSAQGYRMRGDLRTRVWYDDAGRWVGLAFERGGSEIVYRLQRLEGEVPTAPPGRGGAS